VNNIRKFCVFAMLFLIAGCGDRENVKSVNFDKTENILVKKAATGQQALRIAVGGMITPREGFAYYRRFLTYIENKSGTHVDFVDRENYAEINKMLKNGEIDVAFVCGGPYVDGHKEFGMELLAAPVAYGGSVYYSYIIVPKDSPAKKLEDLRGKVFAFTDPLSNTGTLVPTYMLGMLGTTPERFFKKTFFSQSHDKSVKAVAQGIADGAAVDSLIWEYANRKNPEFTSKTKIIVKSPPYGIPPVVARPGLDENVKSGLRKILLNAHADPEGAEILKGMMIDKFITLDDSAYDSIRDIKSLLDKQKKKS